MLIERFRVELTDLYQAAIDDLQPGLNVLHGGNEFSRQHIFRSLANRLFGGPEGARCQAMPIAELVLAGADKQVLAAAEGPAALWHSPMTAADLPILRSVYAFPTNAEAELRLSTIAGDETCLCGRQHGRAPTHGDCGYLRRVAQLLEQATGGYLVELAIAAGGDEARIVDVHGRRLPWSSLSITGKNMIRLSMSLAAIEGWERYHVHLPLLLDNPLAGLRPREAGFAADVIKRFNDGRRQIVLITETALAESYFAGEGIVRRKFASNVPPLAPDPEPVVSLKLTPAAEELDLEIAPEPPPHAQLPPKARLTAALREVGIDSTLAFLNAHVEALALELAPFGYSVHDLAQWQDRAALLHFVPEMNDDDVDVLRGCEVNNLRLLCECDVELVHQSVIRFLQSEAGSRYRRLRTRYERSRIRLWRKLARRRSAHWKATEYGRTLMKLRKREEVPTIRAATAAAESKPQQQFYLHLGSPIVDAPSIGPTMAQRLNEIGIHSVADLLRGTANSIAARLKHRRTKADHVEQWQQQARLMCRVPQLRGHDAQILVALHYTEPEQIARMRPAQLMAAVEPFARSKEGRQIIRNMTPPDLAEVKRWIQWAGQSRRLEAA